MTYLRFISISFGFYTLDRAEQLLKSKGINKQKKTPLQYLEVSRQNKDE